MIKNATIESVRPDYRGGDWFCVWTDFLGRVTNERRICVAD